MQPQAWFFIRPNGIRHGPSFTERQAQVEAARFAAQRPSLDPETALTLYRSLKTVGWRVVSSRTKAIAKPEAQS